MQKTPKTQTENAPSHVALLRRAFRELRHEQWERESQASETEPDSREEPVEETKPQ